MLEVERGTLLHIPLCVAGSKSVDQVGEVIKSHHP